MLKALNIGGTDWYTPTAEEGQERPTEFCLEIPSEADYRAISNAAAPWIRDGAIRVAESTAVHEALVRCLKGWRNFAAHDGAPLDFDALLSDEKDPAKRLAKAIGLIPASVRSELFLPRP
jgi:hypothetical protein